MKTWKTVLKSCSQSAQFFFQYCSPAQNQPKSYILFHKNGSLGDFYIMTLAPHIKELETYIALFKFQEFCMVCFACARFSLQRFSFFTFEKQFLTKKEKRNGRKKKIYGTSLCITGLVRLLVVSVQASFSLLTPRC